MKPILFPSSMQNPVKYHISGQVYEQSDEHDWPPWSQPWARVKIEWIVNPFYVVR
jgi:hypothetical protein